MLCVGVTFEEVAGAVGVSTSVESVDPSVLVSCCVVSCVGVTFEEEVVVLSVCLAVWNLWTPQCSCRVVLCCGCDL